MKIMVEGESRCIKVKICKDEGCEDMRNDDNAVSQVFGILLMVTITIVLAAFITIYAFESSNNKLEKKGYDIGMITDIVYKIQYNPNDASIFLTYHNDSSAIYKVSNNEKELIRRLDGSYKNQTMVEIYYIHIGWLYQISDVQHVKK